MNAVQGSEMIEAAKIAGKKYADTFATLYPLDPSVGMTMVISGFISCYAMMNMSDRAHTMVTLFDIVSDISTERFEDGTDFLDFLKQKITEKKD